MKKFLSVFLAALMIFVMMPTVFAASTPVITTTVDKTNINAGDIVTVTVKVSADSHLCTLAYDLYYNTSEFELVEGSQSLKGEFDLEKYIKDNNLEQVDDTDAIREAVRVVFSNNPNTVEQYKAGQTKVVGFFVGQVMREMRGKAKPETVNKVVAEELAKL